MAWEWVAPVCTASVGVAGIAATYWTGRQARRATVEQVAIQRENTLQDRVRNEKREAYIGYLEATNEARRTAMSIATLLDDPEVTSTKRLTLRTEALADLEHQRERLRLVAPEGIRRLAHGFQLHLYAFIDAVDQRQPFDYEPNWNAALVARMKRDLGYELAPHDVDLETWSPELLADSKRTKETA